MSDRAVQFLVILSHAGTLVVFIIGLVMFGLWRLAIRDEERARQRYEVRRMRAGAFRRKIFGTLFAGSVAVWLVAASHWGCAILMGRRSQCMSNLKVLGTAVSMYSEDYDERLPPSSTWSEAIAPRVQIAAKQRDYTGGEPFRCPATESPASYGMNRALGGLPIAKIELPAATVLLFDADARVRSFSGGANDVARSRHMNSPNVAYTDGHVRPARPAALDQAQWSPKAPPQPNSTGR